MEGGSPRRAGAAGSRAGRANPTRVRARPPVIVGSNPAAAVLSRPVGVWRSLLADPSVLAIIGTVLVVDTVYRQMLTRCR